MGKYEEGLPPLIRHYDGQEEQFEQEEPTVKTVLFELEIPVSLIEELKRVVRQEHRSISKGNMKSEIVNCIKLRIQVANLLKPRGTIIVRRLPNSSEEPIHFVI